MARKGKFVILFSVKTKQTLSSVYVLYIYIYVLLHSWIEMVIQYDEQRTE